MTDWQDIDIPQGTFIGWGEVGQTITGKVLSFAAEGGTDFSQNPCPQVVLELTETVDNYKDKGTVKETIESGELVTLTCGQANLKRAITAASLNVGDLVRVKFDDTYKTANGTGKSFKVQVARAAKAAPQAGDLI